MRWTLAENLILIYYLHRYETELGKGRTRSDVDRQFTETLLEEHPTLKRHGEGTAIGQHLHYLSRLLKGELKKYPDKDAELLNVLGNEE